MQVLEARSSSIPRSASFFPPRHDDDIPAEEKSSELARILASEDFPSTPRKRSLLSFVVKRGLENAGSRARLSAREIATQTLGRPSSFDALRDPIVRIEMAKLRRDLEIYYLKSGRRNPLRIEIPRGVYEPLFRRQKAEAEPPALKQPVLTGNMVKDAADELRRVLDSSDFAATERNRRFLSYVVEKEMAGLRAEITPKLIATRLLGRNSDFRPDLDPIVRIEAGRLRKDLEVYYLKSGRFNPLRITIPKGAYFPVFVPHSHPAVAA